MKELEGKVIFLTGGSDGIGFECFKAYAAAGAHVVIVAINQDQIDRALVEVPGNHLGILCDVAVANQVMHAISKTIEKYGKIDAIHNNAGIAGASKMLHDTTEEEWDALMNVNLRGIFNTIKHGFEALVASKGCILNTSSMVGEIGQSLHAAYTATKGGVNALTKSMALDYAQFGIRVNAVSPAGVWTPMLRSWSQSQPDPAAMESYLNNIHALGYCPNGDVIADACVFLLSEKARFITGCIMPVSGGAELGYKR
jgi:NAD(P)-dependent dehydrogenase (short-subunit alcohol dehydrogenase family)